MLTGLAGHGTVSPAPLATGSGSCFHIWDSGRCFCTEMPQEGTPRFPLCVCWQREALRLLHVMVGVFSSWRDGTGGRRTPQLQWLLSEVSPVLFSFRSRCVLRDSPALTTVPFSVTQAFCHLKGWHLSIGLLQWHLQESKHKILKL